MASDSCCGRLIALFEPNQCAPGEASLAGCAVGYRGRTAKCHCDVSGGLLSEVELMREDMLASGLDSPKVLLCGPCAVSQLTPTTRDASRSGAVAKLMEIAAADRAREAREREVVSCESREAVFEGGQTTESGDYPFIANPGFRGFELESARSDRACV